MAIPAVLICVSLSIVYTACVQHETEQLAFHTYQQAPVDVEVDSKCVNLGHWRIADALRFVTFTIMLHLFHS